MSDEFLPPIEAVAWARNSGDGHPTLEQIDALTDVAGEMLVALKAARDMLAHLSQSTDSYCEICESHAPKSPDAMGRIVGPVPHEDDCPLGMAEAAIANAESTDGA